MPRALLLHFPREQDEVYSLLHRVRNFGEDVFRHMRETGLGTVELAEVDAAIDRFMVRGIHASKLRRVVKWIETEAAAQHLRLEVEVR